MYTCACEKHWGAHTTLGTTPNWFQVTRYKWIQHCICVDPQEAVHVIRNKHPHIHCSQDQNNCNRLPRLLIQWNNRIHILSLYFNNKPGPACYQCVSSLTDEMVPAEDIEIVTQAVLNFQLPQSPDEIQSMINDFYNLLSSATNMQDDMRNLEAHTKTVQDLLQKSQELKSASGKIN